MYISDKDLLGTKSNVLRLTNTIKIQVFDFKILSKQTGLSKMRHIELMFVQLHVSLPSVHLQYFSKF